MSEPVGPRVQRSWRSDLLFVDTGGACWQSQMGFISRIAGGPIARRPTARRGTAGRARRGSPRTRVVASRVLLLDPFLFEPPLNGGAAAVRELRARFARFGPVDDVGAPARRHLRGAADALGLGLLGLDAEAQVRVELRLCGGAVLALVAGAFGRMFQLDVRPLGAWPWVAGAVTAGATSVWLAAGPRRRGSAR